MKNEIYLNWKLATELFHCSRSTYNRRVDEIEEWIRKGRYPKDSILFTTKGRAVARTVLTDYLTNKKALSDKYSSKYVKPFEFENYRHSVSNEELLDYIEEPEKKKEIENLTVLEYVERMCGCGRQTSHIK